MVLHKEGRESWISETLIRTTVGRFDSRRDSSERPLIIHWSGTLTGAKHICSKIDWRAWRWLLCTPQISLTGDLGSWSWWILKSAAFPAFLLKVLLDSVVALSWVLWVDVVCSLPCPILWSFVSSLCVFYWLSPVFARAQELIAYVEMFIFFPDIYNYSKWNRVWGNCRCRPPVCRVYTGANQIQPLTWFANPSNHLLSTRALNVLKQLKAPVSMAAC